MNLKRGFLRLWVLLTLFWMPALIWLQWTELTITRQTFHVTLKAAEPAASEPFDPDAYLRKKAGDAMPYRKRYSIEGPDGATREQALDQIYNQFYSDKPRDQFDRLIDEKIATQAITVETIPNWHRRGMALAVIFGPPLAVMVIGAGLFWVGRGFMRQ
jgi:hypothetical protein